VVAFLYHLLRPGIEALTWRDWGEYRDFADEWLEIQRVQVKALLEGRSDG